MHTTNLQTLLANNAKQITMRHAILGLHLADAKYYAASGEKAYAVEAYKKADKQRPKLAKLVALQRTIKAAIADNARDLRIRAKVARLVAKAGFVSPVPEVELTSREVEAALDDLIAVFIPKKADSRVAQTA